MIKIDFSYFERDQIMDGSNESMNQKTFWVAERVSIKKFIVISEFNTQMRLRCSKKFGMVAFLKNVQKNLRF